MAPSRSSKALAEDAPWRAPSGDNKLIPRISQANSSTLKQNPSPLLQYSLSILKHPDPVGMRLACEAFVEAAGPDCIIPGMTRPVRVLGLQVWPLSMPQVNLKFLEPLGHEMKTFGKLVDKAFDLMQAPFNER